MGDGTFVLCVRLWVNRGIITVQKIIRVNKGVGATLLIQVTM